ncbi:HPr family phosphocarrier protein [Paenibacillus sp. CMAA1364]
MKTNFIIQNPFGIHARPARKIVEAAKSFSRTVSLEKEGKAFNAKSLVSVISIGAKCGDSITVIAEGDEAEAVIQAIGTILNTIEPNAESSQS